MKKPYRAALSEAQAEDLKLLAQLPPQMRLELMTFAAGMVQAATLMDKQQAAAGGETQ
jgi:hypothetical protein